MNNIWQRLLGSASQNSLPPTGPAQLGAASESSVGAPQGSVAPGGLPIMPTLTSPPPQGAFSMGTRRSLAGTTYGPVGTYAEKLGMSPYSESQPESQSAHQGPMERSMPGRGGPMGMGGSSGGGMSSSRSLQRGPGLGGAFGRFGGGMKR